MAEYPISKLGHTRFEHVIQALAKCEIANGIIPFCSGPDGGREASFHGKMNYPSLTKPWEGYLVVQCKFCEHPKDDPGKDGQWALKHLRKELAVYSSGKRRIPEYFLFATNVRLSAVLAKGSKDLIRDELEQFRKLHSLKDYDVWSYDEICCFLNKNQSVRTAYVELTTDGDYSATISKLADALAAKTYIGVTRELPGDKTVSTDGAQGQLYGIRSDKRMGETLGAAGIKYAMEKGREFGRQELAKEVLQVIADKPPTEENSRQILDLLRQGTRVASSISQSTVSDSSLTPSSLISANAVRNEIEVLLRQGKDGDALTLVNMHQPDASWCDLAVYVYVANGDRTQADDVMKWCRAGHDDVLWKRCLVMYAKAEMKKTFSARIVGSVITPDSITAEERAGLGAVKAKISPVIDIAKAKMAAVGDEDKNALMIGTDISYLLGDLDEVRRLSALMESCHPVPPRYVELVCNEIVSPPVNLPDRLRTEYSADFMMQCAAAFVDGMLLKNADRGIETALKLMPMAKNNDEREKLAGILTDLYQSTKEGATKRVETAIEALLAHNGRRQQLFRAHCYLRNGKHSKADGLLTKLRDKNDPQWLQLYAASLAYKKMYEKAAETLARAAEILPHPELLRRASLAALNAKRPDLAQPMLEKIVTLGCGDVAVHSRLAFIYIGQNDNINAARHFEVLHRIAPDEISHSINLAISLSSENPERALEIYNELCAKPAPPLQAICRRAQLFKAMGRVKDAWMSLGKFRSEYWDKPEYVLQVMELGYAADQEEDAGKAFTQLQALQAKGAAGSDILTPLTLDSVKQHIESHREKCKELQLATVHGLAPWLLVDEAEGAGAFWGWLMRTQSLTWLSSEPSERARYSIYTTNGFGPKAFKRSQVSLEPLECSRRSEPVVADLTSLMTLSRLGLLEKSIQYFGKIYIPSSYLPHLLNQGGQLVLHQQSIKSNLSAIHEYIESRKIEAAKAGVDLETSLPYIREYSPDSDARHYYGLRDVAEALHAHGMIKDEVFRQVLRVARRPSGVDAAHPALNRGQSILIDVTTLRTLAQYDALDALAKCFHVCISREDYDRILVELRVIRAQEDAFIWNHKLWDLLRTDERIESCVFETPQIEGIQHASSRGDISFDSELLAQQRKLPLLVDDRVFQSLLLTESRGAGQAFGSSCVVLALAKAGLIDKSAEADAFLQLIQWRYRFLVPTSQILQTLADRFVEHPPGKPLIDLARYAHDCMHDPGLFSGREKTTPPMMMSLRLYVAWGVVIGEFLMNNWLMPDSQERASQLTKWAVGEFLPAIPMSIGPRVWKGIGQMASRVVLGAALAHATSSTEYERGRQGMRAIASELGLSDEEYEKLISQVIDA